jgi:RimJ/RimL family protein N-acetyltransferase
MRYGDDLLHGELVKLTAFTREDIAIMSPWYASMELLRYLRPDVAFPMTQEDEVDWFEAMRKDHHTYSFAVRTLAENKLIGGCSAMRINWPMRHCMVGIAIGDPKAQGKGYGTDAMRVLLRYCFMELNLNRVALQVYSYNMRAVNSYLKIGFQQEGVLRETLLRDGAYHNIIMMSILRREWDALDNKS